MISLCVRCCRHLVFSSQQKANVECSPFAFGFCFDAVLLKINHELVPVHTVPGTCFLMGLREENIFWALHFVPPSALRTKVRIRKPPNAAYTVVPATTVYLKVTRTAEQPTLHSNHLRDRHRPSKTEFFRHAPPPTQNRVIRVFACKAFCHSRFQTSLLLQHLNKIAERSLFRIYS
jgi:hypothetical protein